MDKAKFASTQINVPTEVAADIIAFGKALISDEDLAGKGREDQPHITLKYGVKEEPLTLENAVANYQPFDVEVGNVSVFPPSEQSDGAAPVVLKVNTDLKPLHDDIHKAMGAKEDDFSYSPHLTLAYVKADAASKYDGQPFEKMFKVSAVTLSTAGEAQFHVPLGKVGGSAMQKSFHKFIPLEKMEEQPDGSLYVYGKITGETPDLEKEVCDYATTKPFYKAKAEWQLKATSIPGMEPSLMPHRSMHTLDAIGKGVKLDFDDPAKTIRMGFQVYDPTAIMKYKKGIYIGFSQGGDYVGEKKPDPVFKGCVRYTANPGEVSAVDSPCWPEALIESMKGTSFPLTKANGSIELVKAVIAPPLAKKSAVNMDITNLDAPVINGVAYQKCGPEESTLVIGESHYHVAPVAKSVAEEVAEATVQALIKAGVVAAPPRILEVQKEAKTKRKGGKDLHASDFAYVGDPEDTSTWKLPIHDKAHAQNALARFGQTQGIPDGEKKKVKGKIVAAAKKFGVEVSEEATKIFKLYAFSLANPEQAQSMWRSQVILSGQAGNDAAKVEKLQKSLWDVHDLTDVLSTLSFVYDCLAWEREIEGDSSTVPLDLKQVIEDLVQCYVALVEEETSEIVAALSGKEEKAMDANELKKAAELFKSAMEACKAMAKSHHDTRVAMHKAHHDLMNKVAPEHSALHKAHHDSMVAVEKAHHEGLSKAIAGITGSDTASGGGPTDSGITVDNSGTGAHSAAKAATLEEIGKLLDEKVEKMKTELTAQMDENTTGILKTVFSIADGAAPEAQPGVGDRDAVPAVKVHQTVPVKKDNDTANLGGGPPATPVVADKALAAAALGGDQSALLKLARTIKASPNGVPNTLAQRITR
jgi:2'-5' RNA ligase